MSQHNTSIGAVFTIPSEHHQQHERPNVAAICWTQTMGHGKHKRNDGDDLFVMLPAREANQKGHPGADAKCDSKQEQP